MIVWGVFQNVRINQNFKNSFLGTDVYHAEQGARIERLEKLYNIQLSDVLYFPFRVFYRTGDAGLDEDMLAWYGGYWPMLWVAAPIIVLSVIFPWVVFCVFRDWRKVNLRQANGLFSEKLRTPAEAQVGNLRHKKERKGPQRVKMVKKHPHTGETIQEEDPNPEDFHIHAEGEHAMAVEVDRDEEDDNIAKEQGSDEEEDEDIELGSDVELDVVADEEVERNTNSLKDKEGAHTMGNEDGEERRLNFLSVSEPPTIGIANPNPNATGNGDVNGDGDGKSAVVDDEEDYTEPQFKPRNWECRKAIDLFNLRVTKAAYKALYDSELDCVMSDVDYEEDFCPPDVDEPYSHAVRV